MSKLDFRNATLTDSIFVSVNLDNARFGGVKDFDRLLMVDTAWWKADELSAPLLKYLAENYDPGAEKSLADKPTKDDYIQRVMLLCKTAGSACSATQIKFTETAAAPSK